MLACLCTAVVAAGCGMVWGATHPEKPMADLCDTVSAASKKAWAKLRRKKKEEAAPEAEAPKREAEA